MEDTAGNEVETLVDESQGQEILGGKRIKDMNENLVSRSATEVQPLATSRTETHLVWQSPDRYRSIGGRHLERHLANKHTRPPNQQSRLQIVVE